MREIQFRAAVPYVMKDEYKRFRYLGAGEPQGIATDSFAFQITEIPLRRLGIILKSGLKLEKLDLTAMWVGEQNATAFRYMCSMKPHPWLLAAVLEICRPPIGKHIHFQEASLTN